MKKIKRTIAAALSILMIASSLPAATLPVSAATDPYASKYGVTYNQLFNLYPQYLSPKAERLLTDTLTDNYQRVLDSYSGGDDFIASYMYSLKNGISILGTEFLSGLGLTQSTKTKLISDTSELLMQNICNTDKALSSTVSDISTNFSHMKNIYTAGTLQEQSVLIADLKGACSNLSDAEVEKLAGELFKSSGTLMKYAGNGVEYWQLVVGIIEMQEIEEEMIYRLMRSLPANSSLSEALVILLDDMNKDIVAHVFDNYCTKKAIGLISDAVKETINYIAGEAIFPGALATNLGKLVVKVITDYLYQGAMADDIVQTTYLSTYVTELSMAVSNKKIAFMKSAGSVKTSQISEYEFIYSAYVTTIRTTLESALKMAKSSGEKSLVKQAIAICNTYTYDKYINFCMQELKADIDAGKVKKPSQAASGSAIGVTAEESRISIQEKFRQLQAAYPPNQGVTFTQSYGGAIQCFGFARFAFNKLFDCDMPAWYQNNKRYEYGDTQNVVVLGQLSGSAQMTEANVKELFSNALLGDIIQACGSYSQHTMMVVSADESGVTVYECNHAGECGIYQRKISYAAFAQSYGTPHAVGGCGVTLYRAANYDSLYWDGSAVFYDDSVNFVIDENGVLTKYNGWQRYVVIPEEVTAIGSRAFYNNDKIVRVTMTDNVTSIGSEAFYDCDNLYVCELSNNIETIGSSSFYSCDSLSSVSLPDSVTELGSFAFYDCTALYSVKLSNAMVSIEQYAFYQCVSLLEIVIPNSVTDIENDAFYKCVSLKNVTLSSSLANLGCCAFGDTAIKDITIPKSLDRCGRDWNYSYDFEDKKYSIGAGPFVRCDNLKTVRFESGTTQIAEVLFMGCTGLEKITIPDTVTVIEECAFRDCLRLQTVNIGNSVTDIEVAAFYKCVSLKDVTLSSSLANLGCCAFGDTAIEDITIPKSLDRCSRDWNYSYDFEDKKYSIGAGPFVRCDNLKTVRFESGTTQIAEVLFMGCTGLEEITIPDTVTVIEECAFRDCLRLRTVNIGNSVTSIGNSAFNQCVSLPEIAIPNSVTDIEVAAFYKCVSLKNVTLSNSLTYLGHGAFGDTAIEDITIPKSLDRCGRDWNYSYDFEDKKYSIGAGPFVRCDNLKTVRFESGTTQIAEVLFMGCTGLEEITIPDTVTVIENFAFRDCLQLRMVNIGNSVTSIELDAFYQCVSLPEIIIPDSVTEIGEDAFSKCVSMTEMEIPDSVTDIGQYAFSDCFSLSKIKLPNRRVNIPSHMFYKCTSLTTIALPRTVEYIRDSAFSGCTALESFTFPDGSNLKEIENSAFYGCTALKEAVLPETTSRIGQSAFQNCVSLEKVSIPQSTKTIGSYAFQGCELLSNLQIADYSITEISSQSFKDCPGLAKITLPKGLQTIGGEAFRNDTGLLEVNIPESVKTISNTAFSYPDKTTFFGKAGSYAETFADEKGFLFVSDTIAAEGIALLDGVEDVVMDRGASYRAVFETFPEEATDVITLSASNSNVSIMGHDIYARYTGDTVITATASSGVTCEFTVHIRDASSISIINQPDKVDYIMGEQLDLTGLRVQVNYGDKSVGEVTDYTVSGFDSSVEGTCQVTVKWMAADGYSYTTKFTVNIIDPRPKLTGILIDTLPDKQEYARKDSLDLTGMIVKATYTDGSSAAITGYTVSGYNALKSGTQTITVTYGDFTTSFIVKVGVEVRKIEIATAPDKTEYFVGEALETEGLTVKVTYTDGSTKIITESYVLEGFDSDTAGTKTVTVQYGGQTATFVVEVKEAEFLYGDANGDQIIDMKDVVLLRKYMAEFDYDLNTSTVAVEAGADVNGDGVFDMKDVVLLRKYMADFDYDTGTSGVALGPQ